MFRLATALALLCLVHGKAKYCCFPAQWEGEEGFTTGSSDDEGHTALDVGSAKVSYDVTGQRFLLDQSLESGNETRRYQILQLYAQNVEYIVENGRCTRVPLKEYNPATNCIPDNATVVGRYRMGLKQDLLVTEYMWNQAQITVQLSVNDDCVPVVSKTYGNINGDNIMQGMGYLGVTPGIKDPSVFNIPSICNKAEGNTSPRGLGGPIFLIPRLK